MKNFVWIGLLLLTGLARAAPENGEHVYVRHSNEAVRVWTNATDNVSLAGILWDIRSSGANTISVSVVNYYTASLASTCLVYTATNSPGGANFTTFPAGAVKVPIGDRVRSELAGATNAIAILNSMRE